MRVLVFVLGIALFIRHDTAFTLARLAEMTPAAVFYLLGGALEIVLCVIILLLAAAQRESVWRSLLLALCCIGIVEGAMISGCKIAVGGANPPAGMTQCTFATGLPIGSVALALEIMALCWITGRHLHALWMSRK